MTNIEIKKTYKVNHSRKGIFELNITRIDEEWVTGIIVNGMAKAILSYNERLIGDEITIRRSFCSFEEIKAA